MPLPASIISLISSGASSGGSATPLPTATALVTELLPPDAGCAPFSDDAACVGAAPASVNPGSGALESLAWAVAAPATGCTALAWLLVGSGGRSAATVAVAVAETIGVVALASAGRCSF